MVLVEEELVEEELVDDVVDEDDTLDETVKLAEEL